METKFNTLYSIDKNGKIKEWTIHVKNNTTNSIITYSSGYIDGKKVTRTLVIDSGKNIGKSNETTHYTQAVLDATSKYNKKLEREGYSLQIPNKATPEQLINNLGLENKVEYYFPMLAQDYFKYPHKLQLPAMIQSKLDGFRCIYNNKNGTVMSRQNKSFDAIKQTQLYKDLQSSFKNQNIVLDGELYIHNGVFEHLGVLRKKTLTTQDLIKLNDIEYHVYDIIDEQKVYIDRYTVLQNLFKQINSTKIKLVDTFEITTENQIKDFHQKFLNDNYEGSILRNKNGLYKCKYRSYDLLKYKNFIDAEYTIVDFTSENDTTGQNKPLIVWVCKTESGNLFNIRPKGEHSERVMLYQKCKDNFNEFKNRKLWVKFFELTENKTPRFPTTKTDSYTSYIRDIIE